MGFAKIKGKGKTAKMSVEIGSQLFFRFEKEVVIYLDKIFTGLFPAQMDVGQSTFRTIQIDIPYRGK